MKLDRLCINYRPPWGADVPSTVTETQFYHRHCPHKHQDELHRARSCSLRWVCSGPLICLTKQRQCHSPAICAACGLCVCVCPGQTNRRCHFLSHTYRSNMGLFHVLTPLCTTLCMIFRSIDFIPSPFLYYFFLFISFDPFPPSVVMKCTHDEIDCEGLTDLSPALSVTTDSMKRGCCKTFILSVFHVRKTTKHSRKAHMHSGWC